MPSLHRSLLPSQYLVVSSASPVPRSDDLEVGRLHLDATRPLWLFTLWTLEMRREAQQCSPFGKLLSTTQHRAPGNAFSSQIHALVHGPHSLELDDKFALFADLQGARHCFASLITPQCLDVVLHLSTKINARLTKSAKSARTLITLQYLRPIHAARWIQPHQRALQKLLHLLPRIPWRN